MNKKKIDWQDWVSKVLHVPTTIVLIGVGVLFSILILKGFYDVVVGAASGDELTTVLEQVFLLLLFVEVVASIKIYFSEDNHFPLRFFIYIGITHLVRYIIISHDSARDVLFLSLALLVLVVSLGLYEVKSMYLKKKYRDDDEQHFEL